MSCPDKACRFEPSCSVKAAAGVCRQVRQVPAKADALRMLIAASRSVRHWGGESHVL